MKTIIHVCLLFFVLSHEVLAAPGQPEMPPITFDFMAHSMRGSIRDVEVSLPSSAAEPFFIPNRGFSAVRTYLGPVTGAIKFFQGKKGQPWGAPDLLLPVRAEWEGAVVFLFTDGKAGGEGDLQMVPVAVPRSRLKPGGVLIFNYTSIPLVAKIGKEVVPAAPGSRQIVESVTAGGALNVILMELHDAGYDFLYRNAFRAKDNAFTFFFVLTDPKADREMKVHVVQVPVDGA